MTNERYKELMAQVGMPNSRSLLTALQQAVNETQQKEYKKESYPCPECEDGNVIPKRGKSGWECDLCDYEYEDKDGK